MKVPVIVLLIFALFQDRCFAHVHWVTYNEFPDCRAKTTWENTLDSIGKSDLDAKVYDKNVFMETCPENYLTLGIMYALVDVENNVLAYGENFSSMQSAKYTIHNLQKREILKVVAATSIRYICLPEELGFWSKIGKHVSYILKVAVVCKSVMRLINKSIVKTICNACISIARELTQMVVRGSRRAIRDRSRSNQ